MVDKPPSAGAVELQSVDNPNHSGGPGLHATIFAKGAQC
jgi:hypothetical protein